MDTWACDIAWRWRLDELSAGQVLAVMAGRNAPVRVLDAIMARIDALATTEEQDAALRAFGPVALHIWTPSLGCAGRAIFLRLARLGSRKAVEILGHAVDSDEVRTALIEILRAELSARALSPNTNSGPRHYYTTGLFNEVTVALSRAAVDHADARAALLEGLAEPDFDPYVLSAAAVTDGGTRKALIELAKTTKRKSSRSRAVSGLAQAAASDHDARGIVLAYVLGGGDAAQSQFRFDRLECLPSRCVANGLLAFPSLFHLRWLADLPAARLSLTRDFLLDEESRTQDGESFVLTEMMSGRVMDQRHLELMSWLAVHSDTRTALFQQARSGSSRAVFVLALCAATDHQARCDLQALVRDGPEIVVRALANAGAATEERPDPGGLAGRVRACGVALVDDETIRDRLLCLGSPFAVRLLLHWCAENVSDVSRRLLHELLDGHHSWSLLAELAALAVNHPLARNVLLAQLERVNEPQTLFPLFWSDYLVDVAEALAGAAVTDSITRNVLIELAQNGWEGAIHGLGRAAVEHEGARRVLETGVRSGDSTAVRALMASASVHESSLRVLLDLASSGSITVIDALTEIIEKVHPTLRLAAARHFFEYATSSNPVYDKQFVEVLEAAVSDLWL